MFNFVVLFLDYILAVVLIAFNAIFRESIMRTQINQLSISVFKISLFVNYLA